MAFKHHFFHVSWSLTLAGKEFFPTTSAGIKEMLYTNEVLDYLVDHPWSSHSLMKSPGSEIHYISRLDTRRNSPLGAQGCRWSLLLITASRVNKYKKSHYIINQGSCRGKKLLWNSSSRHFQRLLGFFDGIRHKGWVHKSMEKCNENGKCNVAAGYLSVGCNLAIHRGCTITFLQVRILPESLYCLPTIEFPSLPSLT